MAQHGIGFSEKKNNECILIQRSEHRGWKSIYF